jgi:hypothetical protein
MPKRRSCHFFVRADAAARGRAAQACERFFVLLESLHKVPLRVLANDPQRVAEEQKRISEKHPTTTDATMRPTRAFLPRLCQIPIGQRELREKMANGKDPVRRAMCSLTLLTGLRGGDKQRNRSRMASRPCGGPMFRATE